jgi:3'(2'), 5'-bisphosphate nucleotidase
MTLTIQQIEDLIELIKRVMAVSLDFYDHSQYNTKFKTDKSPVTDADHFISDLIKVGLQDIAPGVTIISEEDDQTNLQSLLQADHIWLVDPIDGTKSFINKNGNFTINIGLLNKGIPVFGIIAEPLLNEIYFTDAANKAIRIRNNIREHISTNHLERDGFNVVVSRTYARNQDDHVLNTLPILTKTGISSSYKFCMVADGRADFYSHLGPTYAWDTVAGHALVRAAGGTVVDRKRKLFSYKRLNIDNPPFLAFNQLVNKYFDNL